MSDESSFRGEVREFLAEALTDELRAAAESATWILLDRDASLAWQRKLYERGWVGYQWPVEFGGTGWTARQQFIFEYECALAGAPPLVPMGLRMVSQVIMRFGSVYQQRFYLPRILSGEDYWCQGYSEPQAGSDLASLRCFARSDGDHYVVTGQKIWTTHAQWANRIFCLVRTSVEARPQRGITFLLVDMRLPGITVRPIMSIGGDHDVNEVFFDDVRVPKTDRVAEEGQGWACAKYLLEFERGGAVVAPGLMASIRRLKFIATQQADGRGGVLAGRAWVRRRIAEIELDVRSLEATEFEQLRQSSSGDSPGALASLLKVEFSEIDQRVTRLAVELIGPQALRLESLRPLSGPVPGGLVPSYVRSVTPRYLNTRAASIYGGSNEIQRSLIARNILGS